MGHKLSLPQEFYMRATEPVPVTRKHHAPSYPFLRLNL